MSKKKAFSGSTMTLKDFHGGSIPSDLPLPSAPGVTARPLDRGVYERPIGGGWGSGAIAGTGRSEHLRPRPGSAGGGASRMLEDATPFLPHIGRNFDEDERKPFDPSSAPRRVSAPPVDERPIKSMEPRPETHLQVLGQGRPVSSPSMHLTAPGNQSFGGSVAGIVGSPASQSRGAGSSSSVSLSAWGVKKDAVMEPSSQLASSGAAAASRFAQASAIEKISSGKWQSRHISFNQQPNGDITRLSENAGGDVKIKGSNEVVADGMSGRRYPERVDLERDYCGATTPVHLETKERYPECLKECSYEFERVRPLSAEGRFISQQLRQQDITEVSERLRLNVLPRTKPIRLPDVQEKQVYQPPVMGGGNAENANVLHGNLNPSVMGFSRTDGGYPPVDRPKLNLLPRSPHIEPTVESSDKEREKVFGGARPREIVLREREIDDVILTDHDQTSQVNKIKHEAAKTEVKPELPVRTNWLGEKAENYTHEHKSGRDFRKDQRTEPDKTETHKGSWRNDNWRNPMEMDKPLELRREPESWRKPEQQPPDIPGPRFGKAASPLELAQAFSRSISDTTSKTSATSQRNLPASSPVHFSRLTGTTEIYSGATRRHINGY